MMLVDFIPSDVDKSVENGGGINSHVSNILARGLYLLKPLFLSDLRHLVERGTNRSLIKTLQS